MKYERYLDPIDYEYWEEEVDWPNNMLKIANIYIKMYIGMYRINIC